jgi:hypothetical protein
MQNAFGDNLTQQVYLRVFTDKPYNPSSVLILPAQEHESTHRYVYTTFYSSPSDLPGFWPTSGPVIAVKYFGNDNNGTLVVKEPPFHMTVRLVTLDDVAPLCSGGIRRSAVGHYASEIGGVCSTPSVEGGLTDVLRSLKDLLSKDSDPPGDTGDPDDGTGDTEDSGEETKKQEVLPTPDRPLLSSQQAVACHLLPSSETDRSSRILRTPTLGLFTAAG